MTSPQRRKQNKRKPNVFHQIISSLFDAASAMWKQRNSDRHRRENGTDISVETKIDRKIRNLYGKKSSVMNDDVDTYYDVDIKTRLNHSLQSKKDWIIRWEHSIYASIKRAKRDAKRKTNPIWKLFNHDKPPRFFVRRNRALKTARDNNRKNRNRRKTTLTSTEGFTILPVKRSTSQPPKPKPPPKYQEEMPSVRQYFRKQWIQQVKQKMKRQERRIEDRYGNGWHK